jgi:hypothetical protein
MKWYVALIVQENGILKECDDPGYKRKRLRPKKKRPVQFGPMLGNRPPAREPVRWAYADGMEAVGIAVVEDKYRPLDLSVDDWKPFVVGGKSRIFNVFPGDSIRIDYPIELVALFLSPQENQLSQRLLSFLDGEEN